MSAIALDLQDQNPKNCSTFTKSNYKDLYRRLLPNTNVLVSKANALQHTILKAPQESTQKIPGPHPFLL